MKQLLLLTALASTSMAFAQVPPPPPPNTTCDGIPRCYVVPDDHPALDGANSIYDPETDTMFFSDPATRKGDCGKYLKNHELAHQKQNREGRLKGNPWAELEAQQEAPIYNCGTDGPRGSLGRYPDPKTPW